MDGRATTWVTAVGLLLFGLAGCVEADLGDAPFFCNGGQPKCPEGYRCLSQGPGGRAICVKEGVTPPTFDVGGSTVKKDKGPVVKKDGPSVTKDRGPLPPDRGIVLDTNTPTPDQYKPTTDMWVPPAPDLGGSSPIICYVKSDCKDKAKPCCCKVPYLPVKTCLAFCLDPFCLPL